MSAIHWGIIGCGDVTEVKSGPGFQKAERSALAAVMRRNGALAEDYAKRHQVAKWYSDAEALIHDAEVEAVYIATPPAFHKEYAIASAKAGKPVYVEKPMAMNYEDCVQMIAACKEAKVPLYVAYYRRALPRFIKIKQLIESGAVGDVRFVSTVHYHPPLQMDAAAPPWRVQPELAGGGLFYDVASHTLDILDFLLGPIAQVHGFASNQQHLYAAEDIVSGAYVFESGVHGTGMWCFSAFRRSDQNEIVGTKGKLVFSTFGHEPVQLITDQAAQEWSFDPPPHIQQPLIQTIVNERYGLGSCPSTGESAARTNWVMEKMVEGYYKATQQPSE